MLSQDLLKSAETHEEAVVQRPDYSIPIPSSPLPTCPEANSEGRTECMQSLVARQAHSFRWIIHMVAPWAIIRPNMSREVYQKDKLKK